MKAGIDYRVCLRSRIPIAWLFAAVFFWSVTPLLVQSQGPGGQGQGQGGQAQARERALAQMPEGKGKEIVGARCGNCHALTRVTEMRNSREGWQEIVQNMVRAFSAPLTPDEVATVADYLATNFPGEPKATTQLAPLSPDNVKVEIKEWEVPWKGTRPRDPSVAADGTIWFVGQQGHYIANLNPTTGEFKRYDLEDGTGPHTNILDKKGNVWFTGNRVGYIGKLDPQTGAIEKFPMPDPAARDPHSMFLDKNENIWFTVQQGNFVGKLETATGTVRLTKITTENARPYGILVDPEGFPWFNQVGTNKVGRMEPKSMEITNYTLPDPKARDRRIARTSDGYIWYTDFARGYLGRLDPKSGEVKEWQNPAKERSGPYAIATDDKGRIWFSETGVIPTRLVGFDPKTEKFFSITEIPSLGGSIRHMVFDPKTRSIWFGTDAGTIGRASIP
ncbi:MAG: lyase [Acidobacteria bacterium]|nr:lyase [Acidobacteriota bacterium]